MARARYALGERLGIGATAEVLLAQMQDDADSRTVALKLVLPQVSLQRELLRAFIAEAELAAGLVHPNITRVLELGSMRGRYFIAMEYVDGVDLSAVQAHLESAGKRLSISAAVDVVQQLLAALEYAHARDVIHRDVSPHNVLVARDGLVKLCDFGLAQVESEQSQRSRTKTLRGKLAYMAPEHAHGKPYTRAADLFSVAIIGYELLSGAPLYDADDDTDALALARAADIPPLSQPDLSAALVQVFTQALDRDPERRFASAADFSAALSRAASGGRHELTELVVGLCPERVLPMLAAPARAERTGVSAVNAPRGERRAVLLVVGCAFVLLVALWSARSWFQKPESEPLAVNPPPPLVPPPEVVRPAEVGYLSVNAHPWAHVFVDGKRVPDTPLRRFPLPVGTHQIRLVAPTSVKARDFSVDIEADKTVTRLITW